MNFCQYALFWYFWEVSSGLCCSPVHISLITVSPRAHWSLIQRPICGVSEVILMYCCLLRHICGQKTNMGKSHQVFALKESFLERCCTHAICRPSRRIHHVSSSLQILQSTTAMPGCTAMLRQSLKDRVRHMCKSQWSVYFPPQQIFLRQSLGRLYYCIRLESAEHIRYCNLPIGWLGFLRGCLYSHLQGAFEILWHLLNMQIFKTRTWSTTPRRLFLGDLQLGSVPPNTQSRCAPCCGWPAMGNEDHTAPEWLKWNWWQCFWDLIGPPLASLKVDVSGLTWQRYAKVGRANPKGEHFF